MIKNQIALLLACTSLVAHSQGNAVKTLSDRKGALTPAEQQETFTLPEGFVIELVASEENGLINPIDIAFDDAGRMWTQTAQMYPLDPVSGMSWGDLLKYLEDDPALVEQKFPEYKRVKDLYQMKTKGEDKILLIEDPTQKVEGQIKVYADGLSIPQSILPYKNGVYVAHGSEMLYFEDTDGDDQADRHETVLTGFGFNDSHTMSHLLVRGPGEWVHFSHGALNAGKVKAVKSGNTQHIQYSKIARFSLDGERIEVLNNGINNIWGFQLKAKGQWYGTEANDMSFSLIPFHPMMGYPSIGNDKIRPYQPIAAPVHQFRVGGTGLSSLAFDENGAAGFPAEWQNIGFLANPITNTINSVVCDRNPDGSLVSEHKADFLTCSDDWFRPVNLEFGPDGCLYIVDWYNKVVSHNEVSRDHPDRDKAHGRIWRVRHESQVPGQIPNLKTVPNAELVSHLTAPIIWQKRAAWQQIVDRDAQELVPALTAQFHNSTLDATTRIHTLWALEGLGAYQHDFMIAVSNDGDPDLRREIVRSIATFQPSIEQVVELVTPLANDPHYMVREQVLRTLAEINVANQDSIALLMNACVPAGSSNRFGHGYEANFQRFLARKAFELYPTELSEFLQSDRAKSLPQHSLDWATEAVGHTLKKQLFIQNWKGQKIDKELLMSVVPLVESKEVFDLIRPQLSTPEFLQLALEVQPEVDSQLLHKAVIPGMKNLVDSDEHRPLVMKVANAFRSDAIDHQLPKHGLRLKPEDVSADMIDAIGINPGAGGSILLRLVQSPQASLANKARALSRLYPRYKKAEVYKAAQALAASLTPADQESLVSALAQTSTGSALLLELFAEDLLPTSGLSAELCERIASFNAAHPVSARLLEEGQAKHAAAEEERTQKLAQYIKATETLEGNPQIGQAMFNSCLACHQAGGQGYDIAPALDGSANRDIHHLLTAIVKPNEAVEGGYRIYRVVTVSGDIHEGYMYSNTDYGVTLAYMGGAKQFIPRHRIRQQRHVNTSFMPSSFGNFPDQTMVDLVSYIKTLK